MLFGDSSFIVHYMRYVGWNLNKVEQTGSNMGTNQRHDNPFLCNIGRGTMVSDGLSMINTHMSATSFQLAEAKIGDNNYLGNDIFYPPNGRTGANVPARHQDDDPDRRPGARGRRPARLARVRNSAHGRPRPRHERVDRRGDPPRPPAPEERLQPRHRAALPAEPLDVGVRGAGAVDRRARQLRPLRRVRAVRRDRRHRRPPRSLFFVLLERASLRFRRLEPKIASIYDPYFWFHERHWKLSESPITGCSPARRSAP